MEFPPALYYADNLIRYLRTYNCKDIMIDKPAEYEFYDEKLKSMIPYSNETVKSPQP